MKVKRFGVSIPEDLLKQFDDIVKEKEYVGRSEAIRDAMRLYITKHTEETQNILKKQIRKANSHL